MTPFQGATVVTLKTITPLSRLRGAITGSDAPAEFVEIRVGGWGGGGAVLLFIEEGGQTEEVN